MPRDDDAMPLPPLPAPQGVPHVYALNSDPGFLDMIRELLSDLRVRTTVEQMRPNVEVTLGNLRSAAPDLLLVDVVPLREDAERLLSHLEQAEDLCRMPVILASTNPKLAERLANAHAELVRDILPKPFSIEDLVRKLSRTLAGVRSA